jgi:NTP pyrophosphatase (non-canonical NTP hydrolase)
MDHTNELMTILMEECAELTVASSKIIRFGDSKENLLRLQEEVGDVMCMLNLLHEYDMVSWVDVDQQADRKYEKLKMFSDLELA